MFVIQLRYPSGKVIGCLELRSDVQASDTQWESSACDRSPQFMGMVNFTRGVRVEEREEAQEPGLGHWRLRRKRQWGLGGAATELGREAGRWGRVSRGPQEECLRDKRGSACQTLLVWLLGQGLRTDHWI